MVGPKTELILERKTSTADSMCGVDYEWSAIKKVKGTLNILSDRERMMYGKKAEGAEYKFVVDYIFASTIVTTDRFIQGSRIFEIVGKEPALMQKRFITFFLTEQVNG